MCGCHENIRTDIFPGNCRLLPGDVVFRKGEGAASRIVMFADNGGIYSHVGIAVDSAGTMMIVHAVPGEPDFKGDPDRVKMDTPQKFFSTANAACGEVRRLKGGSSAARRAAVYATQVYRRGLCSTTNMTTPTLRRCTAASLLKRHTYMPEKH